MFSTKHRQALIDGSIESELHSYLGGTCKELGCPVLIVGGYIDHIHILCMLSKKIALMTLIEKLKSSSSKWIKTKGEAYSNFYWQDGYGAFSVNPAQVENVVSYIANQLQHHSKKHSKPSIGLFLINIKWNMMNDMFGISWIFWSRWTVRLLNWNRGRLYHPFRALSISFTSMGETPIAMIRRPFRA